ncbi:DUF4054 domain-containing protein [Cupriavidus respiraculi]|uniref:DUF4054 domain-containing protein n=1 Tax=Cupriavidus respiraculi TaxID=195930 RepID=A0ABM8WZR9_9BURK|nr:DUF4054 domain-containing protein [Cupriavidus respiraculi]CAG9173098.1 hypothetical protein LMG21510_02155 [Cupriavidus respiraculi]
MAATIELLDFLAPAVADVPEADKARALEMAAAYRPSCLSAPKQDEAQAWYAAWLLYGRKQQTAGGGGVIVAGVVSEKEGDLSRTFGDTTGGSGVVDPLGFYGQYKRLADLCGAGAITVGRHAYGCGCEGY